MLVGADPYPIVSGFLEAALNEVSHLIRPLIAGWLYYSAVYALGVYLTPRLFLSTAWDSAQLGLIASTRYSSIREHSFARVIASVSAQLRVLFITAPPNHLQTRWHAATHPQLN